MSKIFRSFFRLLSRPGFWFIFILFILVLLPHYFESIDYPKFLLRLMPELNLTRHAFERIFFLVPVVWAGFLFGLRGTIVTLIIALAGILPRASFSSPDPQSALVESGVVLFIGGSVSGLVATTIRFLRRWQEYLIKLQITQTELEHNVEMLTENEKHLTALNQIAGTVSQSLDLSQVLNSAVDKVIEVMQADIALVFLLDQREGVLILTTHSGLSPEFVQYVARTNVGEGFNGQVAASGSPLFVEDASRDSQLTRGAVSRNEMHSELIVPLVSKGKVNGTLCVAMRSHRVFDARETELLVAIGQQIGVAVENAYLYQRQQEITDELRISGQRFRELFENAHDAIWIHSLDGQILAANRACVALTGYDQEELNGLSAPSLLTEESQGIIRGIEQRMLAGDLSGSIDELKLVRKERTEALIQVASSLINDKGEPVAFQHIARDITQEKRMQENLHFYLQQATRAQEEERKRISRELHDDTIQALVVLSRQLDALAANNSLSEDNRQSLEDIWQRANNIIQGVRRLSQDLRPAALDRLGLRAALEWLAADVTQYSGIATEFKVAGDERRFAEEVELVLFRIVQEALRNTWRHSQATKASVTLEFDRTRTRLTVSDNGIGFSLPTTMGDLPKEGKLGLAGMQERARLIGGTLVVQSDPGKGSSITLELPA